MLPVFCLALATPARAEQPESNPLRYPYGISAKYATAAELATTNLTPGQLVANQDDFSDLRIGDGATPGGLPVGRAVLERCNMLHAWGGATADEIKAFLALSIADQRPDLEPYATKAALAAASNALANAQTNYLPLAGGALSGGLSVGVNNAGTNDPSLSVGNANTVAFGRGSAAIGVESRVNGANSSVAMGYRAHANHARAFVWNGHNYDHGVYSSSGEGRFEVFPVEGTAGFCIDGTNLPTHISSAVAAHESAYHAWPETCTLHWSSNYFAAAGSNPIPIPTNFPTKKLLIAAGHPGGTAKITFPAWTPDRDVEIIFVLLLASADSRSISISTESGVNVFSSTTTSTTSRNFHFVWDSVVRRWALYQDTSQTPYFITANGSRASIVDDDNSPATVEEWLALHGGGTTPALLSSPAALQPAITPALTPSIDLQPAALAEPEEDPDEPEEDEI